MNYYTNAQILEELNKTVYGHIYAKKVLINAINRSKKRYLQRYRNCYKDDALIPNLSCLLVSESGTGKTFLLEELSRIMQFPLMKFDASHIRPGGWEKDGGFSVDQMIYTINNKALQIFEQQPDKYRSVGGVLSQMVVFIDEFDKLGISQYIGWAEKSQAQLLQLLENKTELKDVTFILAGAFSNLKLRNANTKNMGFFVNNTCKKIEYNDIDQILITGGKILTEILGRISIVIQLDEFTESEYENILLEHILPIINNQFKSMGLTPIKLEDVEKQELVRRAYKSGLGIRAIKRELIAKSMIKEFSQEILTDEDQQMLCPIATVIGNVGR